MSKGSRVVPVRMPDELMEEIMAYIVRRNWATMTEPYSLSTFIRKAIREKLDHAKRSSRKNRRTDKRGAGAGAPQAATVAGDPGRAGPAEEAAVPAVPGD